MKVKGEDMKDFRELKVWQQGMDLSDFLQRVIFIFFQILNQSFQSVEIPDKTSLPLREAHSIGRMKSDEKLFPVFINYFSMLLSDLNFLAEKCKTGCTPEKDDH